MAFVRRIVTNLKKIARRQLPVQQEWLGLAGAMFAGNPRPLIFDVGANVGQTVLSIKARSPQARVFCFEPDPAAYAQLSNTVSKLSSVVPVNLALGDQAGSAVLFQNVASVTNSLLKPAVDVREASWANMMRSVAESTVQVDTVDSWAMRNDLTDIDLLKTDCQGFDLRVLGGAHQMLRENRIRWVCSEVLFTNLYDGQAFVDDILQYMRSFGYGLYGLYDVEKDSRGRIAWCDALFGLPPLP